MALGAINNKVEAMIFWAGLDFWSQHLVVLSVIKIHSITRWIVLVNELIVMDLRSSYELT